MIVTRLLLLSVIVFAGCASVDTDAPGLQKEDVKDALQRGVVLPGMTPRQVRFVWGEPQERRTITNGEQWIYEPDVPAAGAGYHPLVKVAFVQGRVDTVMNGDLKRKHSQTGSFDDLTHRPPHGINDAYSPTGFSGSSPGMRGY